ncbi:MAG TPA: OmpA family protein, partial [Candidatus Kapabacteria bacterium]|nr:OmpA family protein [Candidatus Kapabacteria bacterium]
TLTGTTDNKDAEQGNTALAKTRAQNVKDYLVNEWGIDPSRITVHTRMLPDNPTNPDYPEGDEENRRVEITSDDESLFRPIVHANFAEYSMTPPTMTFGLGANAQACLASWSLVAKRGDATFATFGDTGAPPKQYSWTLTDNVARTVHDSDHITCALTIHDAKGRATTSSSDVPVFKKKSNIEVGRLSLIVFDFDKADISETNRELMQKFVAVAVHPNSTVSIIGSTDRLGEAAHNQELSDARAQNVKKLLLGIKPDANIIECKGIGQSKLLYDNSLSEGRYYCRTVAIDVRTPIDQKSVEQPDPPPDPH